MVKRVIASCLACKKELLEDDHMLMGKYGDTYCSDDCVAKGHVCAGCNHPMDGNTPVFRKDGHLFCCEDCMIDHIPGLRGVTRTHLAFYGEHYQIFLEVAHQAAVTNRKAFAICGQRYVVYDNRTRAELYFSFPSEVEKFVKTGQEIPKE